MEEEILQEQLDKIDKEIDKLEDILEKRESEWDYTKSWDEYREMRKPESTKISSLMRLRRMIMPYKLTEKSDFGHEMSIEDFIDNVKCGGFIDYDGYGIYLKDDKETGIEIYPSDIKYNCIRKEFDRIIWFNR